MSRLTSIEKGGYYAFPDEHLAAVASLFAPANQGGKLLDPCAGEGRALEHLARAWNLTPHANEIDDTRAAACKALFGARQTVHGDLFHLKTSQASFTALWANPPYTWELSGDEKRREFSILKHCWKWAQPDAYVLWVVYSHHITLDAATFLAKHSRQVEVWRLPGLHLGEYTHVVAVAQVGRPEADPAKVAIDLVQAGKANAYPALTVQETPCYRFPAPIERKTFVFCPKVVSPEAALQAVLESGVQFQAGFQTLVAPEPPPEKISPIVRPRGGQLALILAAGLFNGLVLPTEQGRMAVRSTVESTEILTEGDGAVDDSDSSMVEREVYRTQSVITITLLGEDGSVDDISGDGPIAAFIKTHKQRLMAYLDDQFTPLYTFNHSHLNPVLSRSKGGRLYGTQRHVIAACHTALQHRQSVILVGEPGCGKSICGATLAATLQPQMKPGQVTLIMCPPHLVEKWEREVKEAYAATFVQILRNVDDVVAFMDTAARHDANTLNVGILSRETAKLGEGWSVAVQWRKVYDAHWTYGAARPPEERGSEGSRIAISEQPCCPTCGALVTGALSHHERRGNPVSKGSKVEQSADALPVNAAWLRRVPRFCPHCHAALWTKARTFSKGKQVDGHLKNPRVPLAEFIATRYRERLYLYICDEIHECKSAATDQGEAMLILANAATKTLGLTGTLYGGSASTLYAIEYLFNPRVRAKYPWGRGLNRWVRDMGTLERIVEYKPSYDKAGVYSGKRRVEHKPKEAPGCSPLLVQEIIDHCVFVGLSDLGRQMPSFEEIPVPITPDPAVAIGYAEAKQALSKYLFQCRLEGDSSALGMYLQTLLSWPSAPYRTEPCLHRKRLDRDSEVFVEIPVHTIHGLPEDHVYAKEQWLIDTVRDELAQGRGVAVFVRQTGERNIQPRIAKLLTDHIPTARPFILKGSVKADQRETVLNKQVESGTNVLIANPILVQTGLDLCDFPTIIFLEVSYSLYVMGQASRRAWRLIQDQPCRVYYPYYQGLMEHQAVELIGRKQQAAALLYGENTGSGLSALNGDDGGNLLAALAAEIGNDQSVTDLRDLFARHATEADPTESAWFTAETEDVTADIAPTVMAEEVDAVMTENSPRPLMVKLPPKPVYKRRRKVVDMLAMPTNDAPRPPRQAVQFLLVPNPCLEQEDAAEPSPAFTEPQVAQLSLF
jgi:hypothetical protein